MALIDSNKFITHLVWSGLIDKATCGELKEAIELCTVKNIYTKDDMVAMLEDIQLEIEEMKIRSAGFAPYSNDPFRSGVNCSKKVIQQKIDALKEKSDG